MSNQAPNIKLPYEINSNFDSSVRQYLKGFDYHLVLNLGFSYSPQAKEVYQYCADHLGTQYKDWFLVGGGGNPKAQSVLHVKDSKWITMLQLQFPHLIDHSFDII